MILPRPESCSGGQTHDSFDVPGVDFLTFTLDNAKSFDPTKPIYIDAETPELALNASQTRILIRRLIGGLKAAGLQQGECVLVALANNFLYSTIFFGIIGAGGVYYGANPNSQSFELDHALKLAEPKFVITSTDILPSLLQTQEATSMTPERIIVLDAKSFPISVSSDSTPRQILEASSKDSTQHTSFLDLMHHGEADWLRMDNVSVAKSTPAAMFSTSGTSGLPKAAISSHYALVSQYLSMESNAPYEASRLISLPLFHVFAAAFAHVYPIHLGQPLYVLPRFNLEQYTSAIKRFKITDTVMAPPIIHALNRSSLQLSKIFDSIRWIGVGGAPIGAEAMQKFRTHLHESATLSQVWGMTEIGVSMMLHYPEQNCDGSIGRPLPGYEVRLVDSFGGIISAEDEPGELQVRYQGMMIGYKNQPPQEEGDWYATGDLMSRSKGKYYVVGRSKELIKVNGWQVAPAELEGVLLSHPCISDVGVIGVVREDGDTEVPRAYVVRKSSEDGRCSTTSPEEIYDFARARLASYKALNGGIFFVDYIPRTASGKIQRFKLGQMDHFRRSITELLVRNNSTVATQRLGEITDLKARAEERRTATRRSSRISAGQTGLQESTDLMTPQKIAKIASPRRKSRTSLVDKLKALEASRLLPHHRNSTVTS